jgi:hypothetical protein
MRNKIVEALIVALVTGLIAFLGNAVLTYFFDNNARVSVGDSTVIEKNHYVIPLNIISYNEALKDMQIRIPVSITQKQISANKPLQIEIINSNTGHNTGSIIKIKEIPKKISLQLLIITNDSIDSKEIEVYGESLSIERISEVESSVMSQLKYLISQAVIYALFIGISTYWSHKKSEERVAIVKEKQAHLREQLERSDKLLESAEKDTVQVRESLKEYENKLIKAKNDELKKQILLKAKLNDYRKELNFWRNTIRKILYSFPSGDKNANDLMGIITKSLKTHQTNEREEHDFETLKVLSKMIKDIDQE